MQFFLPWKQNLPPQNFLPSSLETHNYKHIIKKTLNMYNP